MSRAGGYTRGQLRAWQVSSPAASGMRAGRSAYVLSSQSHDVAIFYYLSEITSCVSAWSVMQD